MKQALHNEFSSIRALRAAIQKKDITITEVVNSALGFAQQDKHNAFVDINTDATLAEAQNAQQNSIESGLAGVPIAHKDVFVTQGWRTTAASKMLGQYRSPFDATVVTKLKNAGAVSLGKLNCDEFAMGSSNENSAWGAVQNPWDLQAVAGGSSGGSAAAVAAGLVMAATGTDTGGSIRQPAAFCGISGIKPTYGCVSRFGMIAYASSLDQGGAFARSAEDLLEVLDVMAGFDERDSTSLVSCGSELNQEGRIRAQFTLASQNTTSQPLKGLRIGLPKEFFGEGVSAEVDNAIKVALKEFTALGAECVEISLPLTSYSIPAYYVIAAAEASTNLSRYDGVRYGHRAAEYGDLNDMISRSRGEAFGAEVQRRILMGTYVLSHGYYDAFYLQAQKIRRLIADDFQKALSQQCDVIMGPVAPTVAWNLGEKNNDPVAMYLADIFTLGASLSGLPTMSIPCGFGAEETGHGRRPVGLQIIGNYFSEGRLLALAHGFQQVTTWHQRRPTQEGQAS